MAEQIRSFWSHICGIFGAIFGMIAGGTLVTVEQAKAAGLTYTPEKILSNGAVVSYYYGRTYEPYVDKFLSTNGTYCATHCSSLTFESCSDYYRYYVTFKGCADGYYASGLLTQQKDVTMRVGCAISSASGQPVTSTTVGLCGKSVCKVRTLCANSNMKGIVCGGSYTDEYGRSIYWKDRPEEQTSGFCIKCPDYDTVYNNYTSNSASGNFTTNISSACFMSKDTARNDKIEHNGTATGTFVWTSDCNYSE